ncbi:MAG: hypothetical protein IJH60_00640, partial [Eubacterium sp.]|nr:hypothetical protein [Eubacterium sp.]
TPDSTLADILALKEKTGHSTVAVTDDGTPDGRLVGDGQKTGGDRGGSGAYCLCQRSGQPLYG